MPAMQRTVNPARKRPAPASRRDTRPVSRLVRGATGQAALLHSIIAILVGAGIALLACGYVRTFQVTLDPSPATFRWSMATLLLAIALGPRLPRWIFRRLLVPTRAHGGETRTSFLTVNAPAQERDAWWSTGIVGLLAGTAGLMLPWFLHSSQMLYTWALRHFLWNGASLLALEVLCMLVAAPPFVVLGTFAHCVLRLGGEHPGARDWNATALCWMVAGAGAGLLIASFSGSGTAMAAIGAAALLAAALATVWRAAPPGRQSRAQRRALAPAEPEGGAHWTAIMQLAFAAATAAMTSALLVWVHVLSALAPTTDARRLCSAGLMLLSASAGLGLGCRRAAPLTCGAGTFGMHCAFAGVATAVGVACFNLVTRASYVGFLNGPGIWLLWFLCACIPLALMGRASGLGMRALLARSADQKEAGATLLQNLLASAAVICAGVALVLLEHLGSYATLVATALALVGTGGTLVIHDPHKLRTAQRARLACVFGGVVGMTLLMPEAGSRWLGHQERTPRALVESWWVTHDPGQIKPDSARRAATALASADRLVDWYRVGAGCRVCVISLFERARLILPADFSGTVDQFALTSTGGATARPQDGEPALRALRVSRERYDVMILSLEDAPAEFVRRLLDTGLLAHIGARLAPDALLVCVFPEVAEMAELARQKLREADSIGAESHAKTIGVNIHGHRCTALVVDHDADRFGRLAEQFAAGESPDSDRSAAHWRAAGEPHRVATAEH